MRVLFIIYILLVNLYTVHSQQHSNTTNIQPTIMVIPFANKNQQLRDVYERNELVRIAVTKVKEGFDNRGVNTTDLRGKLKQSNNSEILQSEQKQSDIDLVVRNSGADIYVEIEASVNKSESGNSATVIMTAFDAFSGESFANKVANSSKFYTEDQEKLVAKAVETEIDNFLNTIQSKFNDLLENGRTITMNFGISENASYDFDREVGADQDLLSDVIEKWVESRAFKKYYHIQGSTSNRLVYDIVKVPFKGENGDNFKLSKFAADFRSFLKVLGIESDRTIQGSNIVFTLK